MSTLTATTAAEQLLGDVRQMLARHDGAESLDELRELADELSTALRRVRGRITRLAKKDEAPEQSPETVTPTAAPEPSPAAEASPPSEPNVTVRTPDETQSVPEPTQPANPPPTLERMSTVTSPVPPIDAAQHAPRKRRHVFRWFFLAVQALFLIWIIAGVSGSADNCAGEVGDMLDACQAGTAVGAGIGVGLIIFLWAAVDVILGVTYLIVRKK